MNKVAEQTNGSRMAEFFEMPCGKYEVYCSVAGNASRAFPMKECASYKMAIRYADKFLAA